MTSGKRVSACTDGSHCMLSAFEKSPAFAASALSISQRSAWTICKGDALAVKISVSSGSGYRAIGPSKYCRSVNEYMRFCACAGVCGLAPGGCVTCPKPGSATADQVIRAVIAIRERRPVQKRFSLLFNALPDAVHCGKSLLQPSTIIVFSGGSVNWT